MDLVEIKKGLPSALRKIPAARANRMAQDATYGNPATRATQAKFYMGTRVLANTNGRRGIRGYGETMREFSRDGL